MAKLETVVQTQESVLATNKVIRNTYMLLSMTLLFSALCAGIAVVMNMPPLGIIVTLVGYFGLLFLTSKFSNSGLGLLFVFALTGFMGLTLGPIISAYLSLPNGNQLVMTAMGGTGVIFLGLSGHGRFPDGGYTGRVPGRYREPVLHHAGPVAGRVCHVCAADVGTHPVPDQSDREWWRDQLHHGDGNSLCLHL
jgi:hypothetical protein